MNWQKFASTVAGLVAVMFAILFALYLSVRFAGLLSTILYVFLFLMAASLAPLAINLVGNGMPGSTALGRGHIILGAFAFDHHYLVQRDTKWEWCPGDEERVYIDDEWHDIEGGLNNKSVLGWRPFGILRFKDDDTLENVRVDTAAERNTARGRGTTTDGGQSTVERGGFEQVAPPAVTGIDGTWLVDLKRVFTNGVRKIGDIEIIETAEEIIERGQVDDSRFGLDNPTVTFFVALTMGVIVGLLYVWMTGGFQ